MRRGSRASFPIFTSLENVTRSKGSRAISAFFAAALSSLFVAAQCFASSKVDSVDLCQEAFDLHGKLFDRCLFTGEHPFESRTGATVAGEQWRVACRHVVGRRLVDPRGRRRLTGFII